jgi:DNA repair photolyase
MSNIWDKVKIRTDDCQEKDAVAPIIISASRSTDIPAFYSHWFFNRLKKGYVSWVNPFNREVQYISFENVRVVVFWTKNPKPIIPYLKILDDENINYYFQYTVNDYEDEGFEPNVPALKKRIETFYELSELIGKNRVIWRFDPLILTNKLDVKGLIEKIYKVGNSLVSYTDKLVFSFVDVLKYKKVQHNLISELKYFDRDNINNFEFNDEKKDEFAYLLRQKLDLWQKVNSNFKAATCAEGIELEKYQIEHNKCIDDELMIKLFPHDKQLMNFLGYKKDSGQRKECGCIVSKDIGSYNTCGHLCVYCYANSSRKIVERNIRYLKENQRYESESII